MIYMLYIKCGEGGASAFALGDDELNVQDDELASSEGCWICGRGRVWVSHVV